MIQRIQSIYLLIVAVLQGLVAFLVPFWSTQNDEVIDLNVMLHSNQPLLTPVPIAFVVSACMAIATIISFKNRKRQILYNRLNIVINFLLLGIIVYHQLMLPGEASVSEKGIGVFIPLVVIVLLALANKGIMKDEKLVKSVDRLR